MKTQINPSFTRAVLFNLLFAYAISAAAQGKTGENGWTILFDGKSTAAFRGFKREGFPAKGWKVEGGALKTIVGGYEVDIITREKYENF